MMTCGDPFEMRLIDDFVVRGRRIAENPNFGFVSRLWTEDARYGHLFQARKCDSFDVAFDLKVAVVEHLNVQSQWERISIEHLLFLLSVADASNDSASLLASIGSLPGLAKSPNLLTALRQIQSSVPESKWEAVYNWSRLVGWVCPPQTAFVQVIGISPQLLRVLKENPDEFCRLSPDQFENFIANRLDRMGFNVKLTGRTTRKDGGIDIIAVPKVASVGSFILAAQVKHHRGEQKTGRDAVDRLLAWKGTEIGLAMLV